MPSRLVLSVLVGFSASVWALYSLVSGLEFGVAFFQPFSLVVGSLSALLIVFDAWLWRQPWLSWAVKRPVLAGTWAGTLRSSFDAPEGETVGDPKVVCVVVQQTFSVIHLRLLTEESSSRTFTASLVPKPDGTYELAGLYRNEPRVSVQHASGIHHGGLVLSVAGRKSDRLLGFYWTDRGTRGELELAHWVEEQAADFQSARALVSAAAL